MLPFLRTLPGTVLAWLFAPLALLVLGLRLDALLGWLTLAVPLQLFLVLLGMLGLPLARWAALQRQFHPGLHTEGPYALTRHPEYWGHILYILGWMGVAGTPSGLLVTGVVGTLLLLRGVWIEEPSLALHDPERYGPWRGSTPLVPFPIRWRAATRAPSAPPLYLFTRAFIRPLLRAWSGLAHPGPETIPRDGPLIVVANHRSYLDAFLLAASFPRPMAFLTTSEAFRPLLQRFFLRGLGCIRLRRFAPDPTAIRQVLRTLEAGGVVAIFPEGERSWDGGPSPVLPGVARLLQMAGAPLVTVSILGSYRLWPRWGRGPRKTPVRLVWRGAESLPAGGERDVGLWLIDRLASHPTPPTVARRSASDVGRLLWRCPSCGRADAVRGAGDGSVWCIHCRQQGTLLDGTHLDWDGSGFLPLREWARRVALTGEERRSLGSSGPDPARHWPFLRLSDGAGDLPLTARGKGEAVLTPEALVLRARGWRAYLPAETIRAVMVEGSHKLQVATTRRIYELRYRRGSPRGPRAHLEAWLDARGIVYRRG